MTLAEIPPSAGLAPTVPGRKLILQCNLSAGDIVMLTAAVRDLHRCYPGRFLTDVRTPFPELWEHNPHLTPLADNDPEAERIQCSYPLINHCNEAPYHCLHGFVHFLNDRLNLSIIPEVFRGDIHLSGQEKRWFSQVHEVTGEDTPFWLVAAGGKHDVTIKWWSAQRYQEVIDHFRGRILFVQVGEWEDHHPRLEGVIDLRGQTNMRELVRLVYHAQGVLCPVTALMHLAAAVETKDRRVSHRPCVVVAGGREPVHWEAYAHHYFLHTIGALPCCARGGCWRDRTVRLRDGDRRDRPENLCVNVAGGLPRCMDIVNSAAVIKAIDACIRDGAARPLSRSQRRGVERGIAATRSNPYDDQPLTLSSAGLALDRAVSNLPVSGAAGEGRGIVICGGGIGYFTNAWVCIRMLRRLGCRLPIELWHLGSGEVDSAMKRLITPFGVKCVDAVRIRRTHPARRLKTWELKPYAILHSRFREVLLLDADNVPVIDPEFLFEMKAFRKTGAVFWPDYPRPATDGLRKIWRSCGLRRPAEPEFETGQVLVDKSKCWRALRLALWFNENSDFYYQHVHGDKETFHLAFRRLKQPYALVPHPIHRLDATMCQHDFNGRRIFQHRNADKWDLFLRNRRIPGFRFEAECREYVAELRRKWPGKIGPANHPAPRGSRRVSRGPVIEALMISSSGRGPMRDRTLRNFQRTDWGEAPLRIHVAEPGEHPADADHTRLASILEALKANPFRNADYLLLLEDDLDFNEHLRHNLVSWRPLRTGAVMLASLYNPRVRETACDLKNNARIVAPGAARGTQAFLLSRAVVQSLIRRRPADGATVGNGWMPGFRSRHPVFYHAPSLVQHIDLRPDLDPNFQTAMDFDRFWRAPGVGAGSK